MLTSRNRDSTTGICHLVDGRLHGSEPQPTFVILAPRAPTISNSSQEKGEASQQRATDEPLGWASCTIGVFLFDSGKLDNNTALIEL